MSFALIYAFKPETDIHNEHAESRSACNDAALIFAPFNMRSIIPNKNSAPAESEGRPSDTATVAGSAPANAARAAQIKEHNEPQKNLNDRQSRGKTATLTLASEESLPEAFGLGPFVFGAKKVSMMKFGSGTALSISKHSHASHDRQVKSNIEGFEGVEAEAEFYRAGTQRRSSYTQSSHNNVLHGNDTHMTTRSQGTQAYRRSMTQGAPVRGDVHIHTRRTSRPYPSTNPHENLTWSFELNVLPDGRSDPTKETKSSKESSQGTKSSKDEKSVLAMVSGPKITVDGVDPVAVYDLKNHTFKPIDSFYLKHLQRLESDLRRLIFDRSWHRPFRFPSEVSELLAVQQRRSSLDTLSGSALVPSAAAEYLASCLAGECLAPENLVRGLAPQYRNPDCGAHMNASERARLSFAALTLVLARSPLQQRGAPASVGRALTSRRVESSRRSSETVSHVDCCINPCLTDVSRASDMGGWKADERKGCVAPPVIFLQPTTTSCDFEERRCEVLEVENDNFDEDLDSAFRTPQAKHTDAGASFRRGKNDNENDNDNDSENPVGSTGQDLSRRCLGASASDCNVDDNGATLFGDGTGLTSLPPSNRLHHLVTISVSTPLSTVASLDGRSSCSSPSPADGRGLLTPSGLSDSEGRGVRATTRRHVGRSYTSRSHMPQSPVEPFSPRRQKPSLRSYTLGAQRRTLLEWSSPANSPAESMESLDFRRGQSTSSGAASGDSPLKTHSSHTLKKGPAPHRVTILSPASAATASTPTDSAGLRTARTTRFKVASDSPGNSTDDAGSPYENDSPTHHESPGDFKAFAANGFGEAEIAGNLH